MQKIDRLLSNHDALNRLGKALARHQALAEQVRRLLPTPLDRQLQGAVLNGTTLTLFVDSPVWSSRLRYLAPALTRQLVSQGVSVDKLVPAVIPASTAVRRRPRQPAAISAHSAEALRQAAEALEAGPLQEALRRLSRHQP